VGDAVDVANLRLKVEAVEGARIRSVLVSIRRKVDEHGR
jgi:CBS domain containing-hemolysin-like protein